MSGAPITRYRLVGDDDTIRERPLGEFVRYDDHEAAISALRQSLADAEVRGRAAAELERQAITFFACWDVLEEALGHADPERQAKAEALRTAEQAIGHNVKGVDEDPTRAFVAGILYALRRVRDTATTWLHLGIIPPRQEWSDFPAQYTSPHIIHESPPCAGPAGPLTPELRERVRARPLTLIELAAAQAFPRPESVIRQQVLTEVANALKLEATRAMARANSDVCERNEGAANATIELRNLALTWAGRGHVCEDSEHG